MQLKLTTIIVSIAFARLAGAVALPKAEADSESLLSSHPLTPILTGSLERQLICTGIPLGGICTSGLQCCGFPINGCFGPPGLTSIKRCKPA